MCILKRFFVLFCVFILLLNLALLPPRACAVAGALTAVGAAVTVSAFLMACGIYPYVEDGQSFGEWGAQSLQDLWGQYVDSFEGGQLPSGGTVQTFNQIKSFVAGGTLAIAKGTWETLRGFADWIVSTFSLQNHSSGIVLGRASNGLVRLKYYASAPSANQLNSDGTWLQTQFYIDNFSNASTDRSFVVNAGTTFSGDSFGATVYNGRTAFFYYVVPLTKAQYDSSSYFVSFFYSNISSYSSSAAMASTAMSKSFRVIDGVKYYYAIGSAGGGVPIGREAAVSSGSSWYIADYVYPVYDFGNTSSSDVVWDPFFRDGFGLSQSANSGVLVDTANVSIPSALPVESDWGGLAVQGTSNPAGVVEQGVMEREKPVVRSVEVEVQSGTTVDTDTGEVMEDVVTITSEDVVPTVAALSPPASFLSALQTAMTTKFPFCLPFDLARILTAFYVEPQAPVISLTFHDPFTDSDYTITVDLSPWDNVAAVVRNFEAMILLAGFCLNFDKFNIIHLILGGLG